MFHNRSVGLLFYFFNFQILWRSPEDRCLDLIITWISYLNTIVWKHSYLLPFGFFNKGPKHIKVFLPFHKNCYLPWKSTNKYKLTVWRLSSNHSSVLPTLPRKTRGCCYVLTTPPSFMIFCKCFQIEHVSFGILNHLISQSKSNYFPLDL